MFKSVLITSFINGPLTPLRSLIKTRIVYSTLLNTIGEDTITRGGELIQKIGEELYNTPDLYNSIDIEQIMLTTVLFIIATYHNYNITYNKTLYSLDFTQNTKLIVMIALMVLTRNVNSVL